MATRLRRKTHAFRRKAGTPLIAYFLGSAVLPNVAHADSFDFFGLDGSYNVQAAYVAAIRTQKPDDRIINSAPASTIPLPDYMKVPESNNYDDGDRNFDQYALVNNRITLLGEVQLEKNDLGMLLRADAFYDDVYHRRNDNRSRSTINKTNGDTNEEPTGNVDEFSAEAEYYDGQRARMLDAYVYGSWYIGDTGALNVRVGQHIAAWGESLFFSGIALAQSPADATKANVPGADVKSILLPVNQVSMQFSFWDKFTVLGQYKLEYKNTELFPVGTFYSPADVVGPGAQFIWGIQNPLKLSSYDDFNLASNDAVEVVDLINRLGPNLPAGPVLDALNQIATAIDTNSPLDLTIPLDQIAQPGAPKYINVRRAEDIVPSDHGQYGVGFRYQVTPITNVGIFHLRYHNTTPAPVQNYGFATLQYAPDGSPLVTTAAMQDSQGNPLEVPVTYSIRYFDGVHMTAMALSTSMFGANIGAEVTYRDGIDVLVDVDGGLLGPVPSPTRARATQFDLNGIYILSPNFLWDSVAVVANVGYLVINDVDEACGPTSCSKDLTNDKESAAFNFLALIDRKNIFNGWDLQVPVSASTGLKGRPAIAGAFGPLFSEDDHRAAVGTNFTYLQKFTVGVTYSWYFGEPDFKKNPYADRDSVGFTLKYAF